MPAVVVLRYGHRLVRDYRVTSHACLAARAFGAKKMIIAGNSDESIARSIAAVVSKWGGGFSVEFSESWKKTLREYKKRGYFVVHLTMYGVPLQKEIEKIRQQKKLLLIIGSQKVEGEVYTQSDLNVSITQQPHSEIAALAVALDWVFAGKELGKSFGKAKIRVIPKKTGKKVVKK
jgi:tRNA (cytidine56-2'-O)-methyltransferase